jgi:hypothetical protein
VRLFNVAVLLIGGGVLVAVLGALLSALSSRSKAALGGPTIRGDVAMVVLVSGVVALVLGIGLLIYRATTPL